ncbi:MAG: hypothetical protein CMC08_06325 [Flavobacteriaceae bacterium]|nr:hypothetical protein [Flavobacteriaceae bacterium]
MFLLLGSVCIASFFLACNKDDDAPDTPKEEPGFLGEIDFVKNYGGSNLDDAVGVVALDDGTYVVVGSTKSTDGDITDKTATDSDYWVFKVDADGTLLWSYTYGGPMEDVASSISKTQDGGFIISGYSSGNGGDVSGNEGFQDYWIVKISPSGTLQWEQNFGFSGTDQALDVIQTSDGGYFATGFFDVTASGGLGNDNRNAGAHGVGEFWGIKMDANGNKVWRRYFGGSNNDRSYNVLEAADGGFLLTGSAESADFDITNPKGSYDFWVLKTDADGNLLWDASFGGSEIDNGYAASHTADGNFIMAGDTRSTDFDVTTSLGNADLWVVKFNGQGNLIWQKSLGGDQFESARSVEVMENGNYLIAGSTRSANIDISSGNNGQNDIWTLIIDTNGQLVFETTVGGSNIDLGNAATQTNSNELIVVGNTESDDLDIPQNRGNKDAVLIKIK